jgi:hypothetical protein
MNEKLDIYYRLCISTLIAVVLIVILFVGFDNRINDYENYMSGLWVGDEEFCKRAGVSSMMLYVGAPTTSFMTTTRRCHILINNDYANDGFTMVYNKGAIIGLPTIHHDYTITATTKFDEEDILPKQLDVGVSMMKNMLRLYDGETMYGVFYKDHETTELCDLAMKQDDDD